MKKHLLTKILFSTVLAVSALVGVTAFNNASKIQESNAWGNNEMYLIGTFNSWKKEDENYKMTYVKDFYDGSTYFKEYKIETTLKKNDEFKAYHTGGPVYLGPDVQFVTSYFSGGSGDNVKTSKDIKGTLFFQVDNNSTYSRLYFSETLFTVTFDCKGHGTAPASITNLSYGSTINAPEDPTATGYTFDGWYKETECTNAWNFTTDTVTGNTTLYAKWTPITYTIAYYLDGGTGPDPANPTSYNIETSTFTLNHPTKKGNTFIGWTYEGQTTPVNVTIEQGTTGNKAYTANWTSTTNYIIRWGNTFDKDYQWDYVKFENGAASEYKSGEYDYNTGTWTATATFLPIYVTFYSDSSKTKTGTKTEYMPVVHHDPSQFYKINSVDSAPSLSKLTECTLKWKDNASQDLIKAFQFCSSTIYNESGSINARADNGWIDTSHGIGTLGDDGYYSLTIYKGVFDKVAFTKSGGDMTIKTGYQWLDIVVKGSADYCDIDTNRNCEWKKIPTTYTSDYFRIFMYRNGHYSTTDYNWAIHFWSGDTLEYEAIADGYISDGGSKAIAYFDVPTSCILSNVHLQFKCYKSKTGKFEVETDYDSEKQGAIGTYTSGDNANLYFINHDETYKFTLGKGTKGDSISLSDDLVKKILSGCFTCLENKDNGYTNITNFNTCWGLESYISEHPNVTFKDYAKGSTYDGNPTVDTTIKAKYDFMYEKAGKTSGANPYINALINEENITYIIVVSVALLSLTAIGAFYFIRKKKEDSVN